MTLEIRPTLGDLEGLCNRLADTGLPTTPEITDRERNLLEPIAEKLKSMESSPLFKAIWQNTYRTMIGEFQAEFDITLASGVGAFTDALDRALSGFEFCVERSIVALGTRDPVTFEALLAFGTAQSLCGKVEESLVTFRLGFDLASKSAGDDSELAREFASQVEKLEKK